MSGILVIGGSGLVGGLLLDRLAQAGRRDVRALLRRPVAARDGLEQIVAPPFGWAEQAAELHPRTLIVTLGTTIRQAGSQAAFRAVDHDLVLDVAAAARLAGAVHCIAVSAVGASPRSRNFYLRTKGEVEQGLRRLDFARLDLLRPGLLRGKRGGPVRRGERIAIAAAPLTDALLRGRLDRYRSVAAADVAAAIAALAARNAPGCFIHHYREIVGAAGDPAQPPMTNSHR
jgi:uncharacterized protein YbjT (DUF2867 family)